LSSCSPFSFFALEVKLRTSSRMSEMLQPLLTWHRG
jgi:hypothetical protein